MDDVERTQVADVRGSISLHIDGDTRRLIDNAAALLDKMRTAFMVGSAQRQAVDVMLDQRLYPLDPEHHGTFPQAFGRQPAPDPKVRALLRRVPA